MSAAGPAVLVVEDEDDIRSLLVFHLRKEGYAVRGAASGEEALRLMKEEPPALVLLDRMLPGKDGVAVCRRIRSEPAWAGVAVLMLTAKGAEQDVVGGLDAGADDYVVKPFSPTVLMARIRTLLRRRGGPDAPGGGEPADALARGPIAVDPSRHATTVEGEAVELTATEFKLLLCLMRRPGRVFARAQLLDLVHGDLHAVTDRAVDVQLVGLRRKLGTAGDWIETVRGVGYRFREE